jgi:hypothetical protein
MKKQKKGEDYSGKEKKDTEQKKSANRLAKHILVHVIVTHH